MDQVRRPVVHDVKLYTGGNQQQPLMIGSLCVSAYYLLYSNRRHDGQDEITVSHISCDAFIIIITRYHRC